MIPLLALACAAPKGEAPDPDAVQVELWPAEAGQGESLELRLRASGPAFGERAAVLDLGEGVALGEVQARDPWTAVVAAAVAEDAPLGPREGGLRLGEEEYALDFLVRAESFRVEPAEAFLGEALTVALTGRGTSWEAGRHFAAFGEGVEVLDFTVLSATEAQAGLAVRADTWAGARDVEVQSVDGDRLLRAAGFQVERAAMTGVFTPESATRGQTLSFRVEARGTSFVEGEARVELPDSLGRTRDITVSAVTVLTTSALVGQLQVSNGAELGTRDVRVRTAGGGGLWLPDAFTVLPAELSLADVAVDLSFAVDRTLDNTTGTLSESVGASCTFYTPLSPPCPSSGAGGELGSPSRYDLSQAFAMEDPGATGEDCPEDPTWDAGERVWLVGPSNTIALQRERDEQSGQIRYRARDLPLADYVLGQVYDLHIQGVDEGEEGVPAAVLTGVQPTLSRDWSLLSPALWGNDTHSRALPFCLAWTPAGTYPDALLVATLWSRSSPGPLAVEGQVGYVGALPWDDGDFCFEPTELATLAAGTVPVSVYAYDEGPSFGLPGSSYQDNRALTWIRLRGSVVLE